MTFIKAFFYRLLVSIGLLAMLQTLIAIPLNNMFDSQPLYNCFGMDKVYKARNGMEFRFNISPFYQHANTARDANGIKVLGGNRLGPWNFFGLFFNDGFTGPNRAAPGVTIGQSLATNAIGTYTALTAAQTAVGSITTVSTTEMNYPILPNGSAVLATAGGATASAAPYSPYRLGVPGRTVANANVYQVGAPGDATFLDSYRLIAPQASFGLVSIPLNYEKIGVRAQCNIDLSAGIGVSIRGGAVDIKNKPGTFVIDPRIAADLTDTTLTAPPIAYTPTPTSQSDAATLNDVLFSSSGLDAITSQLNYNVVQFRKTSPEDLHVQLYWQRGIQCKDKGGDIGVTVIPYIALGAWIPLAEKCFCRTSRQQITKLWRYGRFFNRP